MIVIGRMGATFGLVRTRPVHTPVDFPIEDKGALDDMVMRRKTATAAQTIYIQGVSKTCEPLIGRLLKISIPETISDAGDLGTYRITKVTHSIDQNHHYECKFEGIPAGLKFFPTPELKIPLITSVQGEVFDKEDPDGLGRVRVEFPFAKDKQSYTWLRVMSPDAGSSETVSKNRGFVFIPEVGDQVMVGFEFGDPNRPYVMGSMFHGKNAEGGGDKNFQKSITTRSGSVLKFTDTEDEEKYVIVLQHNDENSFSISVEKDKGTIKIQSTQDIFLSAPELIQLESKQIILKGETIQVTAEDTIEMVAQKVLHAESADKLEIIGASIAEESEGEFTQKGKEIAIKADSKMDIDGGSKLNVKAGDIKMNQ